MRFIRECLKGLGLLVCMLLLGASLTPAGMLADPQTRLADCLAPAVIESQATLSPPCTRKLWIGYDEKGDLGRSRCLAAPEFSLLI